MANSRLFLLFLCCFFGGAAWAQDIHVYPEQGLNFGDFYVSGNSGGTLVLTKTGELIPSGDIALLVSNYHPAVFTISTNSPVPIKIEVETDARDLRNSRGMEMQVIFDTVEPAIYTIQQGSPVRIYVGGKLQINPGVGFFSGNYSGDLSLRVTALPSY